MISRYVVLFIGIYLAVVNATKNLRHEAVVEDVFANVPVDNARGKRAVASAMKTNALRIEKDSKVLGSEIAKIHKAARAHAKTLKTAGSKTTADMQNMGTTHHVGSLVTRHRPNGDCSGVITSLSAKDMGGCHAEGTDYYTLSCTNPDAPRGEGNIVTMIDYFDNPDCSGNPTNSYEYGSAAPRCSMDSYGDSGPEMITNQCVGRDSWSYLMEGGIKTTMYSYDNQNCDGEGSGFSLRRFGGCELVYEYFDYNGEPSDYETMNDMNRFHYMMIDSCSADSQTMHVRGFTDSSCRRPLYQAEVPIRDENGEYNGCFYMTGGQSGYGRTECVPGPGPNPMP